MQKLLTIIIVCFPILAFSQFTKAELPNWNIKDSAIEKLHQMNNSLRDAQMSIIDSSTIEKNHGIVYKYKFANITDTLTVEYLSYYKGADNDLRIVGVASVKEVSIKGHYMAIAPIYILLMEPAETLETLRDKKTLKGYYVKGNADTGINYFFKKDVDRAGKWEFRIY